MMRITNICQKKTKPAFNALCAFAQRMNASTDDYTSGVDCNSRDGTVSTSVSRADRHSLFALPNA